LKAAHPPLSLPDALALSVARLIDPSRRPTADERSATSSRGRERPPATTLCAQTRPSPPPGAGGVWSETDCAPTKAEAAGGVTMAMP
jgi:hypothetical protein